MTTISSASRIGTQAMRDDDARAAKAAEAVVDRRFGRRIERARGFVEDQDCRFTDERARDLETLTLPAAEVATAFQNVRLVSAVAGANQLVDGGISAGLTDTR